MGCLFDIYYRSIALVGAREKIQLFCIKSAPETDTFSISLNLYTRSKMPYKRTNQRGNSYEAKENGGYRYENADGSSYDDDGKGHSHYTTPDGEDGWHHNQKKDYYTSGKHFRETDSRHKKR